MSMTVVKDFINILYPSLCVCCEEALTYEEKDICVKCEVTLPLLDADTSINENQVLLKNLWGRCFCNGGISLYYFSKKSNVQRILHAIKYKKHTKLATALGRSLGIKIKNESV